MNIIPVNPVKPVFDRPSDKEIAVFSESLKRPDSNAQSDTRKALDIDAACGQLKAEKKE